VKKSKRQLSKRSIAYILAGIVLIFVMTLIGSGVFLRILDIRVEGSYRYTAEEIITVSGLAFGDNLLFLNTQSVTNNIRESNPFADEVTVTRIMPNEVLIEIIESTPTASVAVADEVLIIDASGRVLESMSRAEFTGQRNTTLPALVEVRGITPENPAPGAILRSTRLDADTRIQTMREVLGSLEREGLVENVVYIDVSNITNIHLGYSPEYRVVFGGLSNFRSNLSRLHDFIEEVKRDHPGVPGVINMTDSARQPIFSPNRE